MLGAACSVIPTTWGKNLSLMRKDEKEVNKTLVNKSNLGWEIEKKLQKWLILVWHKSARHVYIMFLGYYIMSLYLGY